MTDIINNSETTIIVATSPYKGIPVPINHAMCQ